MVKRKLVLDKGVLSTSHKEGESQNAYRMNFPSPRDQGYDPSHHYMLSLDLFSLVRSLTSWTRWPQIQQTGYLL